MSEYFFTSTLPILVLTTMIAWDSISTEVKLCKLEKRIRELETDGEK